MTTQSDLKKLAEQMAGSMNSFDNIKDFQKQLMQSFIDTALEAEMVQHYTLLWAESSSNDVSTS